MLLCQDLRRGHEGHLVSVVQIEGSGDRGNDCLPASHVSLEKSIHRFARGDVAEDFPDSANLRFRELKRESLEDGFQFLFGGWARNPFYDFPVLFLTGEEELEEKVGFIEESPARHLQVGGDAEIGVCGMKGL